MSITGNNMYIESKNIRIFPCAYRGDYTEIVSGQETPESLIFDPESKSMTEANFTNTFHKLSTNKESYVVAWIPDTSGNTGTLKCVIGGYYFEIYNHSIKDFFNGETPYYLCIKTTDLNLGTSETDGARTTKILASMEEEKSTNYLEKSTNYLDIEINNTYYFTGLLLSTTPAGVDASAYLKPFIISNETPVVNPTALPITSLLDTGDGNYSLCMIENITDQGTNTTEASGDYSVSLGISTAAMGLASTALGNNTTASAKGALAAGNNTTAEGEGAVALGSDTTASGTNAVALGSNTKAETANQVVIGAYNVKDDTQAFIIANGTNNSNRSNKFTVSKTGNVKALGTLETRGSIKAIGATANELELGTNNIEGSYGSIKVFGENLPNKITDEGGNEIQPDKIPVFKVESTGNTTIAGATAITNETQSSGTTSGALKVAGGVGITKNLNVGGGLSVATDKATTLGGSLTTKGNTTLQGTLTTTLSTTLKDTLLVEKLTTLKAGAAITGDVEITGDAKITRDVEITGNVEIAEKATSAKTTKEDTDTTLTTKSYVDAAKTASNSYIDTKIQDLDFASNEITVAETANGEYLQTIAQVDGKIAATKANFATTFATIDNLNAPTTFATDTHIKDVISNLWIDPLVKGTESASALSMLQTLVLEAVYPIGTIYTQYKAEALSTPECPLAIGTWKLIDNDVFLRSVGENYTYAGNTGGSANAVLISHTHDYTGGFSCTEAGLHTHGVTIKAMKTGSGATTGVNGNSGDTEKGSGNINYPYVEIFSAGAHTHSINTPNIQYKGITDRNVESTVIKGQPGAIDGSGANLPPYVYVYMWRRLA